MNRRSVLIGSTAIPAAAVLSSCQSIGGLAGYLSPAQMAIVNDVLKITTTICGFLPSIEGVVSLLGTVVQGAGVANVVANMICGALPPAPPTGPRASRAGQSLSIVVNNVTVSGVYTR